MNFGNLVKLFRERRGLSLRELAKLAEVDHAYIHRLETGDKNSPSEDIQNSLAKALKLSRKERLALNAIAERELPHTLLDVFFESDEFELEDIFAASGMSFRGVQPQSKEQWQSILQKIKDIREEFERDGK